MEKIVLTRKELYDLVWLEPLHSLAKRLNIEANELIKICVEKNIPIPPKDYWTNMLFGERVKPIELPIEYTGEDAINFSNISKKELVEGITVKCIKVPSKLVEPDELVKKSQKNFNRR